MAVIGSSFLAAGTDEDDDDTEVESFELETKRSEIEALIIARAEG